MPKLPKLYRDATTGQFTTAEDAAARPAETVAETVEARHETPDVAELRRLRDTEREELHSPTRRLDAYYYSFSETGSVPIDAILSAVAIAGKSCHNTDRWTEDDEWSRWGVGRSLVDVIQCAAYEAAAALLDAADRLAHMTEARDNARAWDEGGDFVTRHPGMSAEYVRAANPYRHPEGNRV